MKNLYIKTYGCQMNSYDSDKMVDLLASIGYSVNDDIGKAKLIILNTCHIREKAEDKLFSDLGRINKAKQEGCIIVVAGCIAQALGEELIKKHPYINLVVGTQAYHQMPVLIKKIEENPAEAISIVCSEPRSAHISKTKQKEVRKNLRASKVFTEFTSQPRFDQITAPINQEKASAFLSIQEGCDRFCSFCVVPYTRGSEYSRPVADILKEAEALAKKGAIELTLLGQNVNAYHGKNLEGFETDLAGLLHIIAKKLPEIKRLRYTTSHPLNVNNRLLEAHGLLEALMPYMHLPLQSGSDAILKRMNRKHTAKRYIEIIKTLRSFRPDIAVSSDFIVGFPGETEKDFTATMELVEQVGFAQAYSFNYSIRPGTPAGVMENQVAEEIKKERLHRLQTLLQKQQLAFNKACEGRKMSVLFERHGKAPGQILGKSPYMQSVHVTIDEDLPTESIIGHVREVTIISAMQNSLAAKL